MPHRFAVLFFLAAVAQTGCHGGDSGGQGVVLLRYNPGSESTEQREKGFLETLAKEYPDIKVLSSDQFAGTTPEMALDKATDVLNKYQDRVIGIFAVCEPNATGVLGALANVGVAGKVKALVFDPNPALIKGLSEGKLHGIVLQDPVTMGYLGVKTMLAHLAGNKVEKRIVTGVYVATPENMAEAKMKKLLQPAQFRGASAAPANAKYRIAVIPKGTTHEYWKSVHAGADQAAKEAGNVEILWKGPLQENDTEGQINVVQEFITKKVDGLVLAPLDSQALIASVKDAKQQGIPAVIFDSALGDESVIVSYVATDNYQGGALAARRLAETLKKHRSLEFTIATFRRSAPPHVGDIQALGPTRALKGVSLELPAGGALALIGENGAGKSTLMNVLSGAHSPDEGNMELAGQRYAPAGPHAARRAGVAMIYQELNLAPHLSAVENIMLGQEHSRLGIVDRLAQRRHARAAFERLGHNDFPLETPVGRLSVGMQQLVEIARALASRAKVMIFDEPTSSLARADVDRLFQTIARLRQDGLGIIYISHFLEEIRRVCDSYTVLRDGETVAGGTLAGTTESHIVSLMVGRGIDELYPNVPHMPGETLLTISDLSGMLKPQHVSFELRRGEILGLAGLVGAGRTELVRSIFALAPIRGGRVRVATIFPSPTPKARIRAGLAYVSEDRKGEGLAQARSIADNITYSRIAPYSRWGWLNLNRRQRNVADWMQRLQIKAHSPDSAVESLSGGNQQKVAFARTLHQQADIFLLDEPTRGIDVGTKASIYRMIGDLAAAGHAIIFISSYFQELLRVCDRIGVMSRGRLREIRPAAEWTEESLLSRAIESD